MSFCSTSGQAGHSPGQALDLSKMARSWATTCASWERPTGRPGGSDVAIVTLACPASPACRATICWGQPAHHSQRGRESKGASPRLLRHRGVQSARRHGARDEAGHRVLARTRCGHGGPARFSTFSALLAREAAWRSRMCAPWCSAVRRDHGACAQLLHHQRHSRPPAHPTERLDSIIQRTRDSGAEVVKLMGSSAYYAPLRQRCKWRVLTSTTRSAASCAVYCGASMACTTSTWACPP